MFATSKNLHQVFVVMNRLHMLIDATSSAAADLSAQEYTMLMNISEFDTGLPLRTIQAPYEYAKGPFFAIELLEQKELVDRVRDVADRRGYALMVSDKGKDRLALTEELVGVAMVETFPRLDEQAFEYLVNLLRSLSIRCDSDRTIKSLIPGIPLRMLMDYHALSVRESSQYGMSVAQAMLLCTFDGSQSVRSLEQLVDATSMPERVIEGFMDSLEMKDLVRIDDAYRLKERGATRIDELLRRVDASTDNAIQEHGFSEVRDLLDSLTEYCIHVFA